MKWLRAVIVMLMCGSTVYANEPTTVNLSSAIAAANSTGYIAAGYLDVVVIGMATSGGVLELYNSTFTTSVLISSISLATVGHRDFKNTKVRGLYWRTSTNTNGVSVIYKQP